MYLPLDDHVVREESIPTFFLEEECEICFCVRNERQTTEEKEAGVLDIT